MSVSVRQSMIMIFFLTLLYCQATFVLADTAPEGPDQSNYSLSVMMDTLNVHLKVTPTNGAEEHYPASVSVTMPPIGTTTVELFLSTSNEITASLSEDSLVFTSSGEKEVIITIAVPEAFRSGNYRLTLRGEMATPTGSERSSASTAFTVDQYADAKVSITPLKGSNNPQKFTIIVQNLANGNDSFYLDIVDKDRHRSEGFWFEFGDAYYISNLLPGESREVVLEVSYHSMAELGEHSFVLRVTSMAQSYYDDGVAHEEHFDAPFKIEVTFQGGGGFPWYVTYSLIMVPVIIIIIFIKYRRNKRKMKGRSKRRKRNTKKIGSTEDE